MKIYKNNRIIGEVVEDTYVTNRSSETFMRKFNGFGLSQNIINQLKQMGVKKVIFEYTSSKGKINYYCDLYQFIISDRIWIFENDDLQKFVNVDEMRR